jgi:CheY-like chemotaxis protein
MRLATELLNQLANPNLSMDDRALIRCQLARQLEEAGDYEAARQAMGELWQGVGERPMLAGLDEHTQAEVLLRVGALTGWIGSSRQIENSQEMAKDLLTESIGMFRVLKDHERAAAAQTDLAYCYWREGGFDEARVMLQEALSNIGTAENETRAVTLLRSAIVEMSARRHHDALRIHTEAAPLFDKISDHLLRAKFHNTFANVLNFLSETEYREDYVDRALIEYAAASFHFEQAGHARYQACVENNLGFLFSTIGRFEDGHEHLDRAQMLMTRLRDDVHLAQVDETRARVLLAEGRTVEAEKTVRAAVHTLEKGDERSLLAEALTTHGIVLASLDHHEQARAALTRAANISEQAGDIEGAARAALTLIEQLGGILSDEDLETAIDRAVVLLEKAEDSGTLRRFLKALALAYAIPAPLEWRNFSLRRAVHQYEAHLIRLALSETSGLVTHAARLLGFKHHQSLISLIQSRHKDLLKTRSAVRKRRRQLLGRAKHERVETRRILHIEDNEAVANLVRETLEIERWNVETCADGKVALEKIASNVHYDLILLDNELPGLNGVELVQRARSMPHRERVPIVMLSATVDDAAARLAGADVGLRKPEDIGFLAETISRLLKLERVDDHSLISEERLSQ